MSKPIVKIEMLVDDCSKCPISVDNKCKVLDTDIIEGSILSDCPFEEVECPDNHTQELA